MIRLSALVATLATAGVALADTDTVPEASGAGFPLEAVATVALALLLVAGLLRRGRVR